MARTNATLVIGVLTAGKNYDIINNPDVQPYIDSASMTIDLLVPYFVQRGVNYTSTQLELLERWLAAHRYATSDKTQQSRSTSGASASFTGQTGKGLEATLYGQEVIRMDITGMLDVLDTRRFAFGAWLGKPPSQQIPYWARR